MKFATITTAAVVLTAASSVAADTCRQAQTQDWNFMAGSKKTVILKNAAKALNVLPNSWKRVFFTPGAGQFKGRICADGWGASARQVGIPEKCDASATYITVTGNAEGTASVAISQGNDISTTVTSTESKSHSTGLDVNLEMSFGGAFFITGAKTAFTTKISNDFTLGKSTAVQQSDPQTTTITRTITDLGPGKTCTIAVDQATCRFRGAGHIPLTLSGWLGIEFPSPMKLRMDRPALRTWYVRLETLAKGPTRSQMLPISVTGSVISKGNTDATCKTIDGRKLPTRVTGNAKPTARKPAVRKPAVRKPAARKPATAKPAVRKPTRRDETDSFIADVDEQSSTDLFTRDEKVVDDIEVVGDVFDGEV
ncbi:hypothetical protein DFJ77DRAFT_457745 [Powellomyces hirtus]|nr:hypothetical protein DFJ77DRAFT_457745 [Powellomyces hirtus]